jgi:predicted ester cyclase
MEDAMTRDEVTRLNEQGLAAWNMHDPDAFLDLLADEFVWYDWTNPQPIRDKEAARQYFTDWMQAFPDLHYESVSRIIGDDGVASELEFEGTNSGPLGLGGGQKMPPTSKRVTGHTSYIARVRDGKIVEFRTHPDLAGMLMQLGMMPTAH